MKKILSILICGFLFLNLTGCNNEDSKNIDNNKTNADNNEKINNSSIEETITNYMEALLKNNDSETAYKYIDFVGLNVWQELGMPENALIKEEDASKIIEKYNTYINDKDKVNKINSYVTNILNNDYFKKQNQELANRSTKYTRTEIETITRLFDNLYAVKVTNYYTVNNTNTSYDRYYSLLEKDGKYYFINSYAIYNAKDISLGNLFK